jgi:DNA-binding transcriptional LysR family regulator
VQIPLFHGADDFERGTLHSGVERVPAAGGSGLDAVCEESPASPRVRAFIDWAAQEFAARGAT